MSQIDQLQHLVLHNKWHSSLFMIFAFTSLSVALFEERKTDKSIFNSILMGFYFIFIIMGAVDLCRIHYYPEETLNHMLQNQNKEINKP